MGLNFLLPGLIGIFYGKFVDLYGKKKILFIGTVFLLVGNLGCFISNNVVMCNISRAIQGLNIGCMSVIPEVFFVERFDKNKSIRMISINSSLKVLGLVLGPIIAAQVSKTYSWRFFFLILSIGTIIVLFFVHKMPLLYQKKDSNRIKFTTIVRHKNFIVNNLIISIPILAYFIANLTISFYFLKEIKMSEAKYSYLKSFGPVACFLLAFYIRKFIRQKGGDATIRMGFKVLLIGAIMFLLSAMYAKNNPYYITISLTIYSFLFTILYPPNIIKSFNYFNNNIGLVSGVCFCIRAIFITIGNIIFVFLYNGTIFPAGIVLLIASLISYFLYILNYNKDP
jgi:DHA1 family bicyclomycin/chloramphenicol resistance-like MFS transporter